MKFETILKCHEWYLCQISRTNHAIICLYYCLWKVCNFHMEIFQIKLKYHCSNKLINLNYSTEWSAIWSEISMSSIWNDKYDFRPRFIALHSIQLPLYYSHFEITKFSQYKYFIDQVASLLKSRNKKAFHLILYPNQKWCDIVIERKWCDLKQKWCNFEHKWRDLEQIWFRGKNSD